MLTPEQIADGWIGLFDGETLFGWQPTSNADWKVEDGEIRVSKGDQGFLMTTSEFSDYELHVEFKAPAATNSGVFLRTPLEPKDPTKDCYEVNIAPDDNPFPTGSLVGRRKFGEGGISYLGYEYPGMLAGIADGWTYLDISASEKSIVVLLNGGPEVFDDDANPVPRGRIGLQFREGPVAFRNIRLRPNTGLPLIYGHMMENTDRLAGWRTDQARDAKFDVDPDGVLQVTGGPGELETEDSYGDFVLQLECFVDGDGLNSGVFFRSIPGEFANGYESQINNAVKDGDPTKPVDAGTGAIYRRTTARRVVSKDHEWLYKTIVATGPHIAVWVNGYQVTDWTDDRPPHDNPRNGQRVKPGTISLQAHDPTTNIRFRNLRIAELPPTSP